MPYRRWGICVFILLANVATGLGAVPAKERAALDAIYNALDGPNWKDRTNWEGPAGSECTWSAVTCDPTGSTVTDLNLSWNNARGVLPSEIGDLSNLQTFVAAGSTITGALPPTIGRLTKLQVLNLTGYYSNLATANQISGPIPHEIGQLTSLRELYLAGNAFTGGIPSEVTLLPSLEVLTLDNNPLGGEIPAGLMRLAKLRSLSLDSCRLTGSIPSPISLPALELLDLNGNDLTGPIPASIGQSIHLKQLLLENNHLNGSLPAEVNQLTELTTLDVYHNDLQGELPSLSRLTALKALILSLNHFSGPLGSWIGQLRELTTLTLAFNDFSGPLPAEFFTLPKLQEFQARGEKFSGKLIDFTALTSLQILTLNGNPISGPMPAEIARLTNLEDLDLSAMPLGGAIPPAIGQLGKLTSLQLADSGLTGPIPEELGNLTRLKYLYLQGNALTTLPASLGKLNALLSLHLEDNRFSGSLPGDPFASMTQLVHLSAGGNRFEGAIPPAIVSLPLLEELDLSDNDLTGAVPSVAGVPKLTTLNLAANALTAFPGDLGSLKNLQRLDLSQNQLGGPIPASLTELRSLAILYLYENKLSGRVPASITNLTNLNPSYGLALDRNALYADDAAVKAFLDAANSGWDRTQTITPSDVRVAAQRERSITLSWTPILFSNGPGGYQIFYSESASGPFSVLTTTPDKQTQTFIADGLQPSKSYFFRLSTVSYPEGGQQNVVVSDPSPAVPASTTAGAPAPAGIVVFVYPSEIRQRPGATGTSSYLLGNVGDLPASITLSQKDDLFTQNPSSFTLAGGQTQQITLTGKPLPAGAYAGEARIAGDGVPAGLTVRVPILVTEPPTGTVNALPSLNRIDVAAPVTTSATGSVDFSNVGTATLQGIVVSNVAWIIPPNDLIVIPPGEKRTVTFTVDQSKRPDASSPAGAVTGTLSLVYESGSVSAKGVHSSDATGTSLVTPVTVVYTITPPVQPGNLPPFVAGEVALFIPGIGHVRGSAGLYISDVALVNAYGIDSPKDIKMYYTPSDVTQPTKVTAVSQLEPNQGVTFANVVESVFEDSSLGSLQIRTRSVDQLFVNANIFNVSNAGGTYGTALPIFRSDRALRPGESVFLTGLRRDAARTTYTNLFIQETSGGTATFTIEYFDAAGKTAGETKTGSVAPFRLQPITDTPAAPAVPVGAVAARITNAADSGGRIVAFATPLDALSLDFWTVADWSHELAFPNDQPVIVPVAGSLHGNLNTFFRTDVALTNRSATAAGGTFVFYDSRGTSETRDINLDAGQSALLDDVVGTSFPQAGEALGYLEFQPRNGAFTMTSRTFATRPAVPGTYGTGVPILPRTAALRLGQSKTITGLDVASLQTIGAAKPGTFRSNIGLVETAGKPATVQVTVTYNDIRQALVTGVRLTTLTYNLAAHQSLIKGLAAEIQATNPNVSDLRNVQLKFQVTGGEGAVIVYVSSVDNGTADQLMRIN